MSLRLSLSLSLSFAVSVPLSLPPFPRPSPFSRLSCSHPPCLPFPLPPPSPPLSLPLSLSVPPSPFPSISPYSFRVGRDCLGLAGGSPAPTPSRPPRPPRPPGPPQGRRGTPGAAPPRAPARTRGGRALSEENGVFRRDIGDVSRENEVFAGQGQKVSGAWFRSTDLWVMSPTR